MKLSDLTKLLCNPGPMTGYDRLTALLKINKDNYIEYPRDKLERVLGEYYTRMYLIKSGVGKMTAIDEFLTVVLHVMAGL